MTLTNLGLNNTFYDKLVKINQILTIVNQLTEGNLSVTGTLNISNPTLFNGGVSLNVSNGIISGNGYSISGIRNNNILGTMTNSQIQNNFITVVSDTASLKITNGTVNLGGTVNVNVNLSSSITDYSAVNIAAAVAVAGAANIAMPAYRAANTAQTVSIAAFAAANTEVIGVAAFSRANGQSGVNDTQNTSITNVSGVNDTQNTSITAAFAKANAAFANGNGTISGNVTVSGNISTGNVIVTSNIYISDGQSLYGTGTKRIWLRADNFQSRLSNGAYYLLTEYGTNKITIPSFRFNHAENQYVQTMVNMPGNWNFGNIQVILHTTKIQPESSNTVTWNVAAKCVGTFLDAPLDSTLKVNVSVSTANILTSTTSANLSPANSTSRLLMLEIGRFAAYSVDTSNSDSFLIGAELIYTTNKLMEE